MVPQDDQAAGQDVGEHEEVRVSSRTCALGRGCVSVEAAEEGRVGQEDPEHLEFGSVAHDGVLEEVGEAGESSGHVPG